MSSIISEAADFTAADLGKGRKIGCFWHFSQPGTFALSDRSEKIRT